MYIIIRDVGLDFKTNRQLQSQSSPRSGSRGGEGAGCADMSRVIRRGKQPRALGERAALKKWRWDLIVQVMFLITLANEPSSSLSGVIGGATHSIPRLPVQHQSF